jgi:hypothetical protein
LKDKAVPESAIVESYYSKFTTTRKGLASAEQKHQITMLILTFTKKKKVIILDLKLLGANTTAKINYI